MLASQCSVQLIHHLSPNWIGVTDHNNPFTVDADTRDHYGFEAEGNPANRYFINRGPWLAPLLIAVAQHDPFRLRANDPQRS